MAGIYVHMNGRDTDKAILKLNGVEVEENKQKTILSPKQCLRCKTSNQSTNRFCKNCGLPLDKEQAEIIIKSEQDRKLADDTMNELIKDPEILNLIREKLSQ
jgi:hypothetical protein